MNRMSLEASQKPISLDWKENRVPVSVAFDDIYYAIEDGLAEARHTFINGTELLTRWSLSTEFNVAELGFGTGLNFLATWSHFSSSTTRPKQLNYISCEKFPLTADQIKGALSRWPELEIKSNELLSKYENLHSGWNHFSFENNQIHLHLYSGDISHFFDEFSFQIDAWYMDGFNPKKNPEMWSLDVTRAMAKASKKNSAVATFTVAGEVKRNLKSSGFVIEKKKGFGRKREMLTARMGAA